MNVTAISNRPNTPFGWPRALLLDLDGTLIDSMPDVAAATNELLAGHGLSSLSVDSIRGMMGGGVRRMIARAFAVHGVQLDYLELDRRTNMMMAHYSRRLTDETSLMPGAAKMVRGLSARGIRIGVVTNRPELATRAILDHFALTMSFSIIIGGDSGFARKPAPDMLLHAAAALGCTVDDALFIGDGPADAVAARAAGMRCFLIRGSHPSPRIESLGANAVLDGLFDLPLALHRLAGHEARQRVHG